MFAMSESVRVEHEISLTALCASGALFALRFRRRQAESAQCSVAAAAGVNTEETETRRHRAPMRALRAERRQENVIVEQ